MLIQVTGIDGSGKTTLVEALVQKAQQFGHDAVNLPVLDPESSITKLIRDGLEGRQAFDEHTMRVLYEAGKYERQATIRGLLTQGKMVFMDRYQYENLAYAFAAGQDPYWVNEIQAFQVEPDVTFILDIDPTSTVWKERMAQRGQVDRYDDPAFLVKAMEAFHDYYFLYSHAIVPMDATLPLDDLVEMSWAVIEEERGNTE